MIIHIIGCRPNFVKMVPVWNQVKGEVWHTGQHYDEDLSTAFSCGIPVHNVGANSSRMEDLIRGLRSHFCGIRKSVDDGICIVYGDTNSSLAGAIVAAEKGYKIAHVEAGLTCGDLSLAEERNRRMIDSISTWNFATSNVCEGVPNIHVVGDVMYDVWLNEDHDISKGAYSLLTLHRKEHMADPAKLRALLDLILAKFKKVFFPIHPRTEKFCTEHNIDLSGFKVSKPIPYENFSFILDGVAAVVTDSGGVSKQGVWAGKDTYVLRDSNEWGLTNSGLWGDRLQPNREKLFSGHGDAAEKIAEVLLGKDDKNKR